MHFFVCFDLDICLRFSTIILEISSSDFWSFKLIFCLSAMILIIFFRQCCTLNRFLYCQRRPVYILMELGRPLNIVLIFHN